MDWSEFYGSLNQNTLNPVYVFTGPEEYIKREALEALRKKLLPPGLEALNDATLEDVTAQQITDAAETLPVMCDRRIVTVRDWAPLLSAKSKNEDGEAEWMRKWLENPPASCVVVFYMRVEMDARKKLSVLLKERAQIVSFEFLNDSELSRWCTGRLKPQGKKLSRGALNTLTYIAGRELTRLSGELDKLAAYVGEERAEITEADVRAIVPASLEYRVYTLLERLLEGDVKGSQEMVKSLLQGGQNPVGLLAMLTRQIRQLTHIKCGLDAGKSVPELTRQLKLHPYAAKQSAKQCAKLSAGWLIALYERSVSLDFEVKSGRLRDLDALQSIILDISLAKSRR